jgi:subtilisin family serine protease
MTGTYQRDHMLARAGELKPGDIGLINQVLAGAGITHRLGDPAENPPGNRPADLIRVPIEIDASPFAIHADPLAIQNAVQAARSTNPSLPELYADPQAGAGTIVPGVFFAEGKKSGHGMGWVPAPDFELGPAEPWNPDAPHPVIALLDTGVRPHSWLGDTGDLLQPVSLPFLQDADGLDGWRSPIGPIGPFAFGHTEGTHWGHGTFIAGLIRQAAPQARILSMRVMDSSGKADDIAVINALKWLADTQAVNPDIVLMSFGRRATANDATLPDVRKAVAKVLARPGVKVVASAGNDGSDVPVYPAAFAAEPGLPVISVGAIRSSSEIEPYSNFGPWVHRGWIGTEIVSIHPLTFTGAGQHQISKPFDDPAQPVQADSFAWWSGTSFAAAFVAAQLACEQVPGLPLPPRPAHP